MPLVIQHATFFAYLVFLDLIILITAHILIVLGKFYESQPPLTLKPK